MSTTEAGGGATLDVGGEEVTEGVVEDLVKKPAALTPATRATAASIVAGSGDRLSNRMFGPTASLMSGRLEQPIALTRG